ncbi:hypothetical protein GW17_00028273 [Ensete ventricosum]|nr:hypothetical protein GW17_00028273 [Ensete ventricosum]
MRTTSKPQRTTTIKSNKHTTFGTLGPPCCFCVVHVSIFSIDTFFSIIGKIHDVILYFGVIDILQDYDITKKLEHAYKSLQVDPNSISAVDPKLYSRRFQDFIGRIFMEDD